MSSSSPLNWRILDLTLAVPSGLAVKLTLWSLNSGLWGWCLLVGHVQITSEPTGAQTQFTLTIPSGLATKLIRLPPVADLEFSVSYSIMSSSSPLNRRVLKIEFTFRLLVCPVHHLCTLNSPSLVISNRLCSVCHLWTDEYPISPSLSLCPVRYLWTTRLRVWWFLISYVQFVTSELTDTQI